MNDFCFISVAFNPPYVGQQKRLKESILKIYPYATMFFWSDEMPPNAQPHEKSYYGFKVHAVDYAAKMGFKKIIWLDPACILVKEVDYWFELVKRYGVIAAKDDNLLVNHCANFAYNYFGIYKEDCIKHNYHLVGGSLYVFDFNISTCNYIFNSWKQAELDGVFHSPENEYHRNDESCMALALYRYNSKPVPYDICGYNDVPDPIVIKKHFK